MTDTYIHTPETNIILIGMPGAGKTTVGQHLSKRLDCALIDTDRLIEKHTDRSLQDIVDTEGYLHLREIEASVLLTLDCQNTIISTGGSAVYSAEAMQHLRHLGRVYFLHLPFIDIEQRIDNLNSRGLAKAAGQSLTSLYEERQPLYTLYADQEIRCKGLTPDEVCDLISSAA